jgi:fumarate hydratase subunit beta
MLDDMLNKNQSLPFSIDGAVIYYAGPTPARDNQVIGSLGPTTSGRMDKFSPRLLCLGLCAMIGKGDRSKDVIDAIVKNQAVYFIAIGGAGALLSKCVKSCEVIAFPELGCESIKKLYIENFPVIVAIDKNGNNIYKSAKA